MIKAQRCLLLLTVLLLYPLGPRLLADDRLIVGSKKFNEGYILAEIMAQLLEDRGIRVDRRFGLGGTLICYEALKKGGIDVYPEYSGTLEQEIVRSPHRMSWTELHERLARDYHLELLEPFGFDNTYAIAVKRASARELGLASISDLAGTPHLRFAFSHEFLNRRDGWPGLAATYGLSLHPVGIEHGLAYQAIDEGKIDVTDVYSTDGDIQKYGLVLLEDDRRYFPTYLAAPLLRQGLAPRVAEILGELAGTINDAKMQRLNGRVLLEGKTFSEVAFDFLKQEGLVDTVSEERPRQMWRDLLRRTVTHLKLTLIALLAAMLIAIPLGVLVYRMKGPSKVVIYVAGILQTVPSIALLALMIPVLGIGAAPAIVALFLYALLPILRNTAAALFSIDPVLKKVGMGMGLTVWQRLRFIEIPLAAPTILAGLKTAAVINIGTATLAAFIGAGGLGEPIVTGLALNDTSLILEGAVPAAVLAILTELVFEGIERAMIPRHLLQKATE